MGVTRTLFITFPKSGRHMIDACRNIERRVGLYAPRKKSGVVTHDESKYLTFFKTHKGDLSGNVYYTDGIYKYLKDNGFRIVFVYRDLWDVSVSWWKNLTEKFPKFNNFPTPDGKLLIEQKDPLLVVIREVGRIWKLFEPWMTKADAIFDYAELRGAALLLGKEMKSGEFFRAGNVGDWRKYFEEHHIKEAKELLPILKPSYLWPR